MVKHAKKLNPYTKKNLIQSRVDDEDLKVIETKARLYTASNMSEYVRLACLNYKKGK